MELLSKSLDCLGAVHLHKIIPQGLINLGIYDKNVFISRNKNYYALNNLLEISKMREHLYTKLGINRIENYILLDHIINHSAQVYYNALITHSRRIELAKNALEEDVKNMVALIENQPIKKHVQILPFKNLNITTRGIEMDNKLLIYSYAKAFGDPQSLVITPGLGSILIGPFFKALYNTDYKVVPYSRYKNDSNKNFMIETQSIKKRITILDDNVGSGLSTENLSLMLSKQYTIVSVSAIEYDWYLYDKISNGLSEYKKFNYELYDKLSFLNTRNHRFLDLIKDCLIDNNAQLYIKTLNENGYNQKNWLYKQYVFSKEHSKKYIPRQFFLKTKIFTKKILSIYQEL